MTAYISHAKMPYHQNLSPSAQRSSPHSSLLTVEASPWSGPTAPRSSQLILRFSPVDFRRKSKEQFHGVSREKANFYLKEQSERHLLQNIVPQVWYLQGSLAPLR